MVALLRHCIKFSHSELDLQTQPPSQQIPTLVAAPARFAASWRQSVTAGPDSHGHDLRLLGVGPGPDAA